MALILRSSFQSVMMFSGDGEEASQVSVICVCSCMMPNRMTIYITSQLYMRRATNSHDRFVQSMEWILNQTL
jgi:hypothetical protein